MNFPAIPGRDMSRPFMSLSLMRLLGDSSAPRIEMIDVHLSL